MSTIAIERFDIVHNSYALWLIALVALISSKFHGSDWFKCTLNIIGTRFWLWAALIWNWVLYFEWRCNIARFQLSQLAVSDISHHGNRPNGHENMQCDEIILCFFFVSFSLIRWLLCMFTNRKCADLSRNHFHTWNIATVNVYLTHNCVWSRADSVSLWFQTIFLNFYMFILVLLGISIPTW